MTAMKNKVLAFLLLTALLVVLAWVTPAPAANKDMIALQTMVQDIQQRLQQMQQSIDERMGVMRNIIEQSADSVNKMSASVGTLQASLDKQMQQQRNDTGTQVNQLSAQIQALNDSVDEVKARLAKATKQLDDMAAAQQNLNNPANQQQVQAPPPDVLYSNAYRDYSAGKYDLAATESAQYMKFYPTTDMAGNAQFYLAEIEYRNGNY